MTPSSAPFLARLGSERLALGMVFALTWLLYFNAGYNHVYVYGGSSDALTISGFLWKADWLLHGAPGIDDRSFFGQHFSPLLLPFGLASHLFGFDHGQWFAIVTGLWHALATVIFAAVVRVVARELGFQAAAGISAAAGLAFALTWLHAGMAYLPHFEILEAGLLIGSLALIMRQSWRWAAIALALLWLTREDAGLHLATFLAALTLAVGLQERRWPMDWIALTAGALIAALVAFRLGPLLASYSMNLGQLIYFGEPLFSHLSLADTAERLVRFFTRRTPVWVPLAVLLVAGILLRDLRYIAGVVAVLPWLILNVGLARTGSASSLDGYYAFPILVAVAWPSLVALLEIHQPTGRSSGKAIWLSLQALTLAAASSPPIRLEPPRLGSHYASHRMSIVDVAHTAEASRAFSRAIERHRDELGEVAVTLHAALLAPWTLNRIEWSEDFEAYGRDYASLDTFLAFDHPFSCPHTQAFAARAALPYRYSVPGTRIVLYSRHSREAMPNLAPRLQPVAMDAPLCRWWLREGRPAPHQSR